MSADSLSSQSVCIDEVLNEQEATTEPILETNFQKKSFEELQSRQDADLLLQNENNSNVQLLRDSEVQDEQAQSIDNLQPEFANEQKEEVKELSTELLFANTETCKLEALPDAECSEHALPANCDLLPSTPECIAGEAVKNNTGLECGNFLRDAIIYAVIPMVCICLTS